MSRLLPLMTAIFVMPLFAFADISGAFNNLRYDYPGLDLNSRILGRTCYSLPSGRNALSCNPAFLATEEKKQLRLNLLTDESFTDVQDYRSYIEDEDISGLLGVFEENGGTHISKASTNLWYQHHWWALSYTPLRAGLYSQLRNPALSEITAHALVESEVSLRMGFLYSEDTKLKIGFNFRYIETEFLREKFLILDALSDPDLLSIREQKTLYIDPGLSYEFDGAWRPELSFLVTDLAAIEDGDSQDEKPSIEAGLATSPEFLKGKLRTSAHITTRDDRNELRDRFRWGATYSFEHWADVALSISGNDYGLGLSGSVDSLTYGLGYIRETLRFEDSKIGDDHQVLAELGLVF